MRIFGVASNSPAESAGLREGDLLLKADDSPLFSVDDLQRVMVLSPANTVTLSVLRNGQRISRIVAPTRGMRAA